MDLQIQLEALMALCAVRDHFRKVAHPIVLVSLAREQVREALADCPWDVLREADATLASFPGVPPIDAAEMYAQYADVVDRLVNKHVNPTQREDAKQHVWSKLLEVDVIGKYRARFEDRGPFVAYFRTSVSNVLKNYFRSQSRRHKERPAVDELPEPSDDAWGSSRLECAEAWARAAKKAKRAGAKRLTRKHVENEL